MKPEPKQGEALQRRGFLVRLFLGGAALIWASCRPVADIFQDGGGTDEDAGLLDAGGDLDAGTPDAGDQDAGPTPSCEEDTDPNTQGPFYRAGAPFKTTLREAGLPGVPLTITGRVLGLGDCKPVPKAVLDVWQADATVPYAVYDSVGYRLRGKFNVDSSGAYVLSTIVPGHYLNGAVFRPAHIHFILTAPGLAELTKQLYFAGDPYNSHALDPYWLESLTIPLSDDGAGGKQGAFNFVIQPV